MIARWMIPNFPRDLACPGENEPNYPRGVLGGKGGLGIGCLGGMGPGMGGGITDPRTNGGFGGTRGGFGGTRGGIGGGLCGGMVATKGAVGGIGALGGTRGGIGGG